MRTRVVLILIGLGLVMAVSAAPVGAGVGIESADLSVQKFDLLDPVPAGEVVHYVIPVFNLGPDPAANVQVIDFFPPFMTVDEVVAPPGWFVISSLGVIQINHPGLLFPGIGGAITVDLVVDPGVTPGTVVTNTAQVTSPTLDFNPGNNTASAQTTITAGEGIVLTKSASPGTVPPGGALTYTITAENPSQFFGLSTTVTDTIPSGIGLQTAVATTGTVTVNPGVPPEVQWDTGAIAPGAIETLTLTTLVDPGTLDGTLITNTAEKLDGGTASVTTTVAAPPPTPTPTPTPTPAASLLDAATAPPTTGSPLAVLGFASLLIGALGVLVLARARRAPRTRA